MDKEKLREIVKKSVEEVWYNRRSMNPVADQTELLTEALHQALSMSGVVSGTKQLCPKCKGQGIVSRPPHIAADQGFWAGIELSYKCNLCDGKMVI